MITILVNESSGSARTGVAALGEAVQRMELPATIVRVRGVEIAAAAKRAAAEGHVLVAAGGDGTVSTVASVAVKSRSIFGVVPLGTLNHFAKDAGIPLDIEQALATIAAGHTRDLDVGAFDASTFINNVSLGLYPRLVWERELERSRGRNRWTAFAVAMVRTWRRYPTVHVRMTIDGVPLDGHTPFVFVGNSEYRADGLGVGRRTSLNAGKLSIYLAPGVDRIEFLTLPLRAVAGRLLADVKFEAFTARNLTLRTRRATVAIAVDGELRLTRTPIRCTVMPGALRTLLPQTT